MNTFDSTVLLIGILSTIPLCLTSVCLIIGYLKNKSPGMQTFNDQVMLDLLYVTTILCPLTVITYVYGTFQAKPVSLDIGKYLLGE
jgi:hypothetical protein